MKYPFNVYQTKVEDHVFWIAEIPALNGCVGQGETADEALKELELNEEAWLETAKEYGIEIPAVPCEKINPYSGKFTVRVAPYVHKAAAELAKKQGVSLNQYVNDAIIAQNSSVSAMENIMPYVADAINKVKLLTLGAFTESSSISNSTVLVSPLIASAYYKQKTAKA